MQDLVTLAFIEGWGWWDYTQSDEGTSQIGSQVPGPSQSEHSKVWPAPLVDDAGSHCHNGRSTRILPWLVVLLFSLPLCTHTIPKDEHTPLMVMAVC